jgi:hypothetical protein
VAGTGVAGFSGDEGPATSANLQSAQAVAVASNGTVYVCANNRIRRISTSGIITTVAGNGLYGYTGDNGPATQAKIGYCRGLAVDTAGSVYMADSDFHVVRKVETSGIIRTVAGTGARGDSGDNGPATSATFLTPYDVDLDSQGYVYILDRDAGAVRRINPSSGIITTYAGSHILGYFGDGLPATQARFSYPNKIAFDSGDNLLVLDTNNNRVRRVDKVTGIINTIAATVRRASSVMADPASKPSCNGRTRSPPMTWATATSAIAPPPHSPSPTITGSADSTRPASSVR